MSSEPRWYALRDLTRSNALRPAYKWLAEAGFEVFTPMTVRLVLEGRQRVRRRMPYFHDLLFVLATREMLDPAVEGCDTLQYRFVRGSFREPMVVPTPQMEAFIAAVATMKRPRFVNPAEVSPALLGARVRVVSPGPMYGYECTLMKVRGARRKRLLLSVEGLLGAVVEVGADEFVELIN